jgi:DNA-binding transcriptional LysR family regulator
MINPQRLLVLRAVLAAGSINAAARNLNYSPATISQHMATLAKQTGLVLFEKNGRGIVPTDAAVHLAEQAGSLLADIERFERTVADLRGSPAKHLAIACMASAAEAWIPDVVKAVRERHPNLTVEISLNEPVDGRGRRPPDLDIRTESVDDAGLRLDGYQRYELITEDLLAVMPAGHPLEESPAIAFSELRDQMWVDHDIYDSPIGRIIRGACAAAGFTPRYAARLDDHHSALSLVAAGIGVTVLPRLALAGLSDQLVVRPVVRPRLRRRIVAHARSDPRRSNLISVAVAQLRTSARTSSSTPAGTSGDALSPGPDQNCPR